MPERFRKLHDRDDWGIQGDWEINVLVVITIVILGWDLTCGIGWQ